MKLHPLPSQPERLFDRPWRPGHPFGPAPSRLRRWGMLALFLFLCTLIGGYIYLTDAGRVRAKAESYLSSLTGGHVRVGSASLSIFEGLRLNDVRVLVDDLPDDQLAPDSELFSAEVILIKYDPRVLIAGRIEATQIIAIDPHVHLTENVDTGRWNTQRMLRAHPPSAEPSGPLEPIALPEILLRSAQVDYSEIRQGQQHSLGSLSIEGRLSPSEDGERYLFEMQSRASASDAVGPVVSGVFSRKTGQTTARLDHFEFGRDVRSMLPAEVREWWEQHGLSGRLDVPVLTFIPADRNDPTSRNRFRVEMELDGVTLTALPQEWLSREELEFRESAHRSWRMLQTLSAGGLRRSNSQDAARQTSAARSGDDRWLIPGINEMLSLEPIRLRYVSGRFVFTERGIEIEHVGGRIENNLITINGRIGGYSPTAPADLRIASSSSEHLFIPAAPKYIASMPRQVRQIYELFQPQGLCDVAIRLHRPEFGARPEVSGAVNVVDGSFVFEKFTYPIRNATGSIVFGPDERSGGDRLDIVDVKGFGIEGGPNAATVVTIAGSIAPLTSDMGANIRISCEGFTNEPAIIAAMPPDVRQALRIFDPTGTGELPRFNGSFTCDVLRPEGFRTKWDVRTDILLSDASGAFAPFPYPLEHVTGKLEVREGYVDIVDVGMKHGETTLDVDGRVSWGKLVGPVAQSSTQPALPTVITPELKIVARHVPIDEKLLSALTSDRRAWIEKVGLGGILDFDGRVFRKTPAADSKGRIGSSIAQLFDIKLRDGRAMPAEGAYAITDLNGELQLTEDRLVLTSMNGRRGSADITGRGTISWPENRPHVAVNAAAKGLVLDAPLYHLLPANGRRAWDEVQPEGIVDVDLVYSGEASPTSADTSPQMDLTIRPRQLAATVKAVPYRLEDIGGSVTYRGGKIVLNDLTARHGDAAIRLSGSGTPSGQSTDRRTAWDLKLAADRVPMDAAFTQALPTALADLATALKVNGAVSFDFSRLLVVTRNSPATTTPATNPHALANVPTPLSAASAPASQPEEASPDVDFDVTVSTPAAALDVGVALSEVDGQVDLSGTIRRGRLNDLRGTMRATTLQIADRPASDFRAAILKSSGDESMRIGDMRGRLAGGELAGEVELDFPRVGPSRYALNLILREADVKTIAADATSDREVKGRMTASLAMEGNWSDTASRRGRGDVSVSGKEMYKIPLVLGLLQITNLALPITSPFSEAGVDYSIDGQRVTAEQITLRSKDMLMQGSGTIDFDSKRVRMSFTTDNPNWPKLPIVGDIVQGAKRELLKINVRGTIEEPKVSASPMHTFTTTIDEVLKGDDEK